MRVRNSRLWGVAAASAVSLALAISAGAGSSSVGYNATPNPVRPNVASLGFQATQTSEFGDFVHLAGTDRVLNTVTVTMSDWALYSDYATDARYASNTVSWSHPITVNVYDSHLVLLGTTTQNVTIPWRP